MSRYPGHKVHPGKMFFCGTTENPFPSSGQDGGVGRNALLPVTTKRRIANNLKTINNQNFQKIKLHGTSATKELKKHSPRLVGEGQQSVDDKGQAKRGWLRGPAARQWTSQARQGWLNSKLMTQS